MIDTSYLIKRKIFNKWNKIFLGGFLLIIFTTIIFRLVISVFQDLGYAFGKIHIGFWSNPQEAFADEFNGFLLSNPGTKWSDFLVAYPNVLNIIEHHPNFFWMLTQFTWLTTFAVFFVILFRFFKFQSRVPSWLKWIMTQRTLSLVNMYDLIVGILFWSMMYQDFNKSFVGDLAQFEIVQTIFVHAVIPCLLFTYSIIFLLRDKHASFLKANFVLKGIIFPAIYLVYYVIMTIIWTDPYSISSMHNALMQNGITNADWGAWGDQIWKALLILILIYFLLGVLSFAHNLLLIKLNKKYSVYNDSDAQKRKQKDSKNIERKIIKKIYKNNWKQAYKNYLE